GPVPGKKGSAPAPAGHVTLQVDHRATDITELFTRPQVPPMPVHAGQGLLYQVTSFVRVRSEVPADTEQLPALAVHEGREPLVSFALHGPPSSVLAIPLPRPTHRQGCHAHPPGVRGEDPEPTASITRGGKGTL